MSKIVVVDDEPNVLVAFKAALDEHDVIALASAEDALRLIEKEQADVLIMDVRMPGMTGFEAIRKVRALDPRLPVILMTGQGTTESAIEATKLGAFDYYLKPFDPEEMVRAVERALESGRLMRRHVELDPAEAPATSDAIIGHGPGMQQVYKAIGRVAETDATVLIRGESGTGKELVARAIYQHSRRSGAPLIVVNCTAIPDTLLESELFGHERGAFTNATNRRIGKFEQAHGGTIFLDEIGDIPQNAQAKILRVLQERCFERLGGNETIHVDVRVLAATNRNLEQAIREGKFREDLYHRLNVVTISLPPLRDRSEDIAKLTDYFVERFSAELGHGKPPVSAEAREALHKHIWPGNVRELEHCMHRVVIFSRGFPIQSADVRQALVQGEQEPATSTAVHESLLQLIQRYLDSYSGSHAHEHFLEEAEKLLVAEALRRTKGNRTQAARLLGTSRPTLHDKMQKYSLGTDGPNH